MLNIYMCVYIYIFTVMSDDIPQSFDDGFDDGITKKIFNKERIGDAYYVTGYHHGYHYAGPHTRELVERGFLDGLNAARGTGIDKVFHGTDTQYQSGYKMGYDSHNPKDELLTVDAVRAKRAFNRYMSRAPNQDVRETFASFNKSGGKTKRRKRKRSKKSKRNKQKK